MIAQDQRWYLDVSIIWINNHDYFGAYMLSLIEQDHKQVDLLLDVLSEQLTQIKAEQEAVNFSLMGDIVQYLRSYIDKYHHPKEDLIYSYYLENYTPDVETLNRLASEHQSLNFLSRELAHSLSMIQLDSVVPFDELTVQLRRFIDKQHEHIVYENTCILPVIVDSFTADDWCHVNHLWANGETQDKQSIAPFLDIFETLLIRIRDENFSEKTVDELFLV